MFGVRIGTALRVPESHWTETAVLGPGQELFDLFLDVQNVSDRPVTILSVGPVKWTGRSTASLLRVMVSPRRESATPADQLYGTFRTFPPSTTAIDGDCLTADLVAASGHVLGPMGSDRNWVVLGLWFRTMQAGRATFDHFQVTYQTRGQRYVQTIPYRVEVPVRDGVHLPVPKSERQCSDRAAFLP